MGRSARRPEDALTAPAAGSIEEESGNVDSALDLRREVETWAESLPKWQRYAISLLANQDTVARDDAQKVYQSFLYQNGLADEDPLPTDFPLELPGASDIADAVRILELRNPTGVNALPNTERLEFAPKLTVIYGANASGKSGYARVLRTFSNAPSAAESVLANVYTEATEQQSCVLKVARSVQDVSRLEWPPDGPDYPHPFAYFDAHVAGSYVQSPQPVEGPRLLGVLTRLAGFVDREICARIDKHLQQWRAVARPWYGVPDGTESAARLAGLTADTDVDELEAFARLPAGEEKRCRDLEAEVKELTDKSREQRNRELSERASALLRQLRALSRAETLLSQEGVREMRGRVDYRHQVEEEAAVSGERDFAAESQPTAGSPAWREFIQAADRLAQIHARETGHDYPSEGDTCLFCRQALSADARHLISSYWTYLRQDVAKRLVEAIKSLDDGLAQLRALDFTSMLDPEAPGALKDEGRRRQLSVHVGVLRGRRDALVEAIANGQDEWALPAPPPSAARLLQEEYGETMSALAKLPDEDPERRKESLSSELRQLAGRQALSRQMPAVRSHVQNLRRARDLGNARPSTQGITRKVSELHKQAFVVDYRRRFARECKTLGLCPELCVDITGQKGSAQRELALAGASDCRLPDVLSEGEQRVAALADFLTEIGGDSPARTIVLDDPVTSLDAAYTDAVAKRLVKEAARRQVIVFTHSLGFLSRLMYLAKQPWSSLHQGHDVRYHWLQRTGPVPGLVSLDEHPDLDESYKEVRRAREALNRARRARGPRRQRAIREGYGAVRAICECVGVRRMLAGVVTPLGPKLNLPRLRDVRVCPDGVEDLIELHNEASEYIEGHWYTNETKDPEPDTRDLEVLIDRLERAIAKVQAAPKLSEVDAAQICATQAEAADGDAEQ